MITQSLNFFIGTMFPAVLTWLMDTQLGDSGISIGIFILSCLILSFFISVILLRPVGRRR